MAVYPPHDYIARHDIPIPAGGVVGYRAGDGLYAQVVSDYGLVLGLDVDAARPQDWQRPAESAPVAKWREFALAQDKTLAREDVDDMTRADLIAKFPDPNAEPAADPDKPSSRRAKP